MDELHVNMLSMNAILYTYNTIINPYSLLPYVVKQRYNLLGLLINCNIGLLLLLITVNLILIVNINSQLRGYSFTSFSDKTNHRTEWKIYVRFSNCINTIKKNKELHVNVLSIKAVLFIARYELLFIYVCLCKWTACEKDTNRPAACVIDKLQVTQLCCFCVLCEISNCHHFSSVVGFLCHLVFLICHNFCRLN